jgi:hydroxymethylbilane synthase
VLTAALGHPEQTDRPLLRTRLSARLALSGDATAAATALGEQVAEQLRAMGAADYLASAG